MPREGAFGEMVLNVGRDLGGILIRNFYLDGTQSDLERDVGVYMELARISRGQGKSLSWQNEDERNAGHCHARRTQAPAAQHQLGDL
ncbi:hypothetical protein SBA6_570024 [Candidatus Sulfopaludibacter sp. SbA6]|nr:hypothetical protein SBA6_570024 [Candidatus Sulfopaludibacter sp. SbA6]